MTEQLAVPRSLDRILKIGGASYRLYAEDWENSFQAEAAASLCAVIVNHAEEETKDAGADFPVCLPIVEAILGIAARYRLDVDDTRPLGFNIILEAVR